MGRHGTIMLALLGCASIIASEQSAFAQRVAPSIYQNTAPTGQPQQRSALPGAPYVEELPPGQNGPEGPFRDDPMVGELGPYSGPSDAHSYHDVYGSPYGGADACGTHVEDCGTGGVLPGRVYVTADYVYARANFSEAIAFFQIDETDPDSTDESFRELDFEYESSYRLGFGYQLPRCGEEIRFLYTRLESYAEASVVANNPDIGVQLPFSANALDDNQLGEIDAWVDLDIYDLEYRKTIPLGGMMSRGCGDACGSACGDPCGSACECPAWDITWSGGIRGASVDWNRSYEVIDVDATTLSDTRSSLDFRGVGPRVGVEGRRYFGCGGWFSIFMKGDISLLVGHLDLDITQTDPGDPEDEDDDFFDTVSHRARQIVPVTEIETGITANVTCHSTFSAGYLLGAWHDLGFRDEFPLVTNLQTQFDDANILSFDGFFARWEWAY